MSELTPITRTETFLAKAGGQSVETPTPITREETFLQAIIDNGGGGGGVALIVHQTIDGSTGTLNKTWQEIYDAFLAGSPIYLDAIAEDLGNGNARLYFNNIFYVAKAGTYMVTFGESDYTANAADGYPTISL